MQAVEARGQTQGLGTGVGGFHHRVLQQVDDHEAAAAPGGAVGDGDGGGRGRGGHVEVLVDGAARGVGRVEINRARQGAGRVLVPAQAAGQGLAFAVGEGNAFHAVGVDADDLHALRPQAGRGAARHELGPQLAVVVQLVEQRKVAPPHFPARAQAQLVAGPGGAAHPAQGPRRGLRQAVGVVGGGGGGLPRVILAVVVAQRAGRGFVQRVGGAAAGGPLEVAGGVVLAAGRDEPGFVGKLLVVGGSRQGAEHGHAAGVVQALGGEDVVLGQIFRLALRGPAHRVGKLLAFAGHGAGQVVGAREGPVAVQVAARVGGGQRPAHLHVERPRVQGQARHYVVDGHAAVTPRVGGRGAGHLVRRGGSRGQVLPRAAHLALPLVAGAGPADGAGQGERLAGPYVHRLFVGGQGLRQVIGAGRQHLAGPGKVRFQDPELELVVGQPQRQVGLVGHRPRARQARQHVGVVDVHVVVAQQQGLQPGQGQHLGRHRPAQVAVVQFQKRQVGELAQLRRDGAPQGVRVQGQKRQVGEPAQLGRDAPRQRVALAGLKIIIVVQVQGSKPAQVAQLFRDAPHEAVAKQAQVGQGRQTAQLRGQLAAHPGALEHQVLQLPQLAQLAGQAAGEQRGVIDLQR